MHIDSYAFGSMMVNGKEYREDLIVFSDKVRSNWWRKEGHKLLLDDLAEVIDYQPEVLIVGKGASGCMTVSDETRDALQEKNIKIIDRNTDQAYKIFNEEIKKATKVVGAFHLTC